VLRRASMRTTCVVSLRKGSWCESNDAGDTATAQDVTALGCAMPEYLGPMHAWRCARCGGVTPLRPNVVPPTLTCMMMGCSGTVRRAPEADWPDLREYGGSD